MSSNLSNSLFFLQLITVPFIMRRKYKQYTDEAMNLATEAILNNTHNIRQASVAFQVPISTLKTNLRKIRAQFNNSQQQLLSHNQIIFQ